jgi:PKD repeat protein
LAKRIEISSSAGSTVILKTVKSSKVLISANQLIATTGGAVLSVDFSANVTVVTQGGTVTFTASGDVGTGINTFFQFHDDSVQFGNTANYTYDTIGSFTVKFFAIREVDAAGGVEVKVGYITVTAAEDSFLFQDDNNYTFHSIKWQIRS